MEEIHFEEDTPTMVIPSAPSPPSPAESTLDCADASILNCGKTHHAMIIEEYETSFNMSDGDILLQDIDGSKTTSCADESKALEGDTASENSDVSEASVSPSLPDNDEKPDVSTSASEHDEKPDGGIVTSGVQNSSSSIASKEADEVKKDAPLPPQTSSQPETLSPTRVKQMDARRAFVETVSRIASVRDAVTMFGGSANWKAQKRNKMEMLQLVDYELTKVEKEIPECKNALEIAEKEQDQVLQELESTYKIIEDLKAKLDKAQTEEEQAKQDSEFAQMRVEEIKKGINDEASIAAKAELDTAKARHEAAVNELALVKDEMETLKREYLMLVEENEKAIRKAENAIAESKETEMTVEQLTLELMSTKESLELAHACHLEAEEKTGESTMARDQELLRQEREMKATEEEIQRLTEQLSSTKDLRAKMETATVLLSNLKAELADYMNESMNSVEDEKFLTSEIEAMQGEDSMLSKLDPTCKELEEVRDKIDKAINEVKSLRASALSLTAELQSEKLALANTKQRQGITTVTITALEAELMKTISDLEATRIREKEIQESIVELPTEMQRAAQEVQEAKLLVQTAREELYRMKEEVELAKAGARTAESRLHAAMKEIEASKASHQLALAAIQSFNDSTTISDVYDHDQTSMVTLSLIEYFELSKNAQVAEELANAKVLAAISEIEAAKEDEIKSMDKLEEANEELATKKEELNVAKQRAESATEGKLSVEQELREWRAQLEARRNEENSSPDITYSSPMSSPNGEHEQRKAFMSPVSEAKAEGLNNDPSSKKKRSLLPKIVMLLTRKKEPLKQL